MAGRAICCEPSSIIPLEEVMDINPPRPILWSRSSMLFRSPISRRSSTSYGRFEVTNTTRGRANQEFVRLFFFDHYEPDCCCYHYSLLHGRIRRNICAAEWYCRQRQVTKYGRAGRWNRTLRPRRTLRARRSEIDQSRINQRRGGVQRFIPAKARASRVL